MIFWIWTPSQRESSQKWTIGKVKNSSESRCIKARMTAPKENSSLRWVRRAYRLKIRRRSRTKSLCRKYSKENRSKKTRRKKTSKKTMIRKIKRVRRIGRTGSWARKSPRSWMSRQRWQRSSVPSIWVTRLKTHWQEVTNKKTKKTRCRARNKMPTNKRNTTIWRESKSWPPSKPTRSRNSFNPTRRVSTGPRLTW